MLGGANICMQSNLSSTQLLYQILGKKVSVLSCTCSSKQELAGRKIMLTWSAARHSRRRGVPRRQGSYQIPKRMQTG